MSRNASELVKILPGVTTTANGADSAGPVVIKSTVGYTYGTVYNTASSLVPAINAAGYRHLPPDLSSREEPTIPSRGR